MFEVYLSHEAEKIYLKANPKTTRLLDHCLELNFHRPFVLEEQDSLETQRSLNKIFLIENREMPILYKPLTIGEESLQRSRRVFVCRYLPTNKLAFLCVLRDSAVNANNLLLFLISTLLSFQTDTIRITYKGTS